MNDLKLFFCAVFVIASTSLCYADNCIPTIEVKFSVDGTSVQVTSTKDLSNVVLEFCDASNDYKFDGLSGLTGTFSYQDKLLAGVWVKSGCNSSGDGPGYGEYFANSAECTSPTPTPTPTPKKVLICHLTGSDNPKAVDLVVDEDAVQAHLDHGDRVGACVFDCAGAPFGQAKYDECGVCGGDNSTCKDCAGVPNGDAKIDECGVCDGDGTSCLDCAGIPNGDSKYDLCGVCGGDNSTCKDCLGVPNGNAKIDECGVCNGQNNTCLDCAGVPNGNARPDACGVCEGDGTSCLDCAGIPNGNSKLDKCGVCGGDNSTCSDCLGQPNGNAKIDVCGVCNGDGTSCSDCAGVPNGNAKYDLCGVCNGNNDCLDCAGVPNGGTIVDKCGVCDGDGGELVKIKTKKTKIRREIRTIYNEKVVKYFVRAGDCSKAWKKLLGKDVTRAKKVFKRAIKKVNELITEVRLCPGECITVINKKTIKAINRLLDKLHVLARTAQLGARAACKYNGPPGSHQTGRDIDNVRDEVKDCPNKVCN